MNERDSIVGKINPSLIVAGDAAPDSFVSGLKAGEIITLPMNFVPNDAAVRYLESKISQRGKYRIAMDTWKFFHLECWSSQWQFTAIPVITPPREVDGEVTIGMQLTEVEDRQVMHPPLWMKALNVLVGSWLIHARGLWSRVSAKYFRVERPES